MADVKRKGILVTGATGKQGGAAIPYYGIPLDSFRQYLIRTRLGIGEAA